jgi:hypothetical protein
MTSVSTVLTSSQASHLGLSMTVFSSVWSFTVFPVCVCILTCSCHEGTTYIGLEPIRMTSLNLNYFFTDGIIMVLY